MCGGDKECKGSKATLCTTTSDLVGRVATSRDPAQVKQTCSLGADLAPVVVTETASTTPGKARSTVAIVEQEERKKKVASAGAVVSFIPRSQKLKGAIGDGATVTYEELPILDTKSGKALVRQWSACFERADGTPVDVAVHMSHGYVYRRRTIRGRRIVMKHDALVRSRYEGVPRSLREKDSESDHRRAVMQEDASWVPADDKAARYRSSLRLITQHLEMDVIISAKIVLDVALVEKVPSVLLVMTSCRAMAEPSLANAFHARGTQFVIGIRRAGNQYCTDRCMQDFFRKWSAKNFDAAHICGLFKECWVDKSDMQGRRPLLSYRSDLLSSEDIGKGYSKYFREWKSPRRA